MKKYFLIILILIFGKFCFAQCNNFTKISSSCVAQHILAIKADGTLWSWGYNFNGQLGNNTTTNSNTPIQIGTDNNWKEIATGDSHSMAIKTDGTLWAWGYNTSGQLGNGTTVDSYVPIQIGTDKNWETIACGSFFSIGLKTNGQIWAWGYNAYGNLGDGTSTNKLHPTLLITINNCKAITTGLYHTLAIKNDGTLWSWGYNGYGNLGDGTTLNRSSPVQVGTSNNWFNIKAGVYHSIGLKTDGTLQAWGSNASGELGIGNTTNMTNPTTITGLTNVTHIAAGSNCTYALKKDGTTYAWGFNNFGQLAIGNTTNQTSPALISTSIVYKSIGTSSSSLFVISNKSQHYSCGNNGQGQLGNGTITNNSTLATFGTSLNFLGIANTNTTSNQIQTSYNTYQNSCNIMASVQNLGAKPIIGNVNTRVWLETTQPTTLGSIYAKRHIEISPTFNSDKSTGRVTLYFTQQEFDDFNAVSLTDLPTGPTDNTGKSNVLIEKRLGYSIDSTGAFESYGIASNINPDDSEILWNASANYWEITFDVNGFGGFWLKTNSGLLASQCSHFKIVSASKIGNFGMGIKSNGTLWAWGSNTEGQLGDGTLINKASIFNAEQTNEWKEISVGRVHSIGIKNNGTIWAWGHNGFGQYGIGTLLSSLIPKSLDNNTNWLKVEAGDYHNIAIKTDGTLWSAGYNAFGQLGIGNTTNQTNWVQIGTDNQWKKISVGTNGNLAIKNNGTLWAWGDNNYGQIGDGTFIAKITPTQIGGATDWKEISTGPFHCLAIKNDGSLWAWGYNPYGQLGNGATLNINSPIQIGTDNNWQTVSAGILHSTAIKKDGSLWAWGYNGSGQFGNGTIIDSNIPIQIGTNLDWRFVYAANYATFTISKIGNLYASGLNTASQLGDGTTVAQSSQTITSFGATYNGLTASNTNATQIQKPINIYSNNCDLIATVYATGSNPISGLTTTKVWIESTQPATPGTIYVKRHYEITPANNAATATGRITLYFTQQEFDDFNAVSLADLPAGATDLAGKANLLIEKRGGSGDANGNLLSYIGAPTNILVDDNDIVWNPILNRWEVTFDVTGFSGFWVKTITGYLSVNNKLQLYTSLNTQHFPVLQWQVQHNHAVKFELEKSLNGIDFVRFKTIESLGQGLSDYQFIEPVSLKETTFFRVKQINSNGDFMYSNIQKLTNFFTDITIQVWPNPAPNNIQLWIPITLTKQPLQIFSIQGKYVKSLILNNQLTTITTNDFSRGIYLFKFSNGQTKKVIIDRP